MILQKKTINNVPQLVPLTADTGSGNPIGTIIAVYTNQVPAGYLFCDGSEFDETAYPALYALLGDNHTPDLREVTLKGIGESGRNVTAHVKSGGLTVGEFIDDRIQEHQHNTLVTGVSGSAILVTGTGVAGDGTTNQYLTLDVINARKGDTTEVKAVGVKYCIKATTGLDESQQDYVLNALKYRMFPDYANQITIPSGTTTWTATEDCYVVIGQISTSRSTVTINGVAVSSNDESQGVTVAHFSGYLRKGQIISWEYLDQPTLARIFPLTAL